MALRRLTDPTTRQYRSRSCSPTSPIRRGKPQPITTAPQIEIDLNNGVDRYVFIGTGRLLDSPTSRRRVPSRRRRCTRFATARSTRRPGRTGLPIAPRSYAGAGAGGRRDRVARRRAERLVRRPCRSGRRRAHRHRRRGRLERLHLHRHRSRSPIPASSSLPANIYARDYATAESLIYTGGVERRASTPTKAAVGLSSWRWRIRDESFPVIALVFTKETNASIEPVTIRNRAPSAAATACRGACCGE